MLDEIITMLNAHFDLAPSEKVGRYKFNSRMRQIEESVLTCITELNSLVRHYNYSVSLDKMLHECIVCGIQDKSIQMKLGSESQLVLARATKILMMMQAVVRNAKNLSM